MATLSGGPSRGAGPDDKTLSHGQLLARRLAARSEGSRVVHCHGCFDIVHPGHIRHLRFAKSLGDILLVSITGDAEMKKGAGRPLIPEELRAENLAALDCVDWVYVEGRPTAAELLEEVRPDVYIKGKEYEFNHDPRFQAERRTVERHGGRVVFSSGDVVFSSTALIAAMEQSADPFHARLSRLTRTPELDGPALCSLIAGFRGKRVVVIGETIQDTYVLCDRPEVAGESPIMTLRPLERRHYDGGAAVIARHIAAMGAKPLLITALPRSAEGEAVRRRLLLEGVEVRALPVESALPEKQRFLVGTQKVMKLDLLEALVLDASQHDRLIGLAADSAGDGGGAHAAIIADFGHGLLTSTMISKLCRAIRPKVDVMAGDISGRRSSLRAMRSMDLLCPTESELRDAYRMYDEGLPAVVWKLLEETRTRSTLVTLGADGLIAFDRLAVAPGADIGWKTRLRGEHVPALTPHAIDALGCGDSLLAATALGLAAGGSLLAASFIGSVAAAAQAQRIGNIPITSTDLRQGIARIHAAHLSFQGAEAIDARSFTTSGGGGVRPPPSPSDARDSVVSAS